MGPTPLAVNLITRRDFQGVESEAYYGAATEHGGGEQLNVSTIAGLKRDRGGFVFAYDYTNNHSLTLQQTGLVVSPIFNSGGQTPIATNLSPGAQQHSGFVSGHFLATDWIELYGDGLYSSQKQNSVVNSVIYPGATTVSNSTSDRDITSYNVSGGARISLADSWTLDVSGNAGVQSETDNALNYVDFGSSPYSYFGYIHNRGQLSGVSAVADGPLPSIGNVAPHAAFGVEGRWEKFELNNTATGGVTSSDEFERSRSVRSAFFEVSIPVTPDHPISGLKRLNLSFAGRVDDYSDFGHTFNPQIGLLWDPVENLTLRGAYSTAFRAPSLIDYQNPPTGLLSTFLTGPEHPLLLLNGGNPNIGPEKATIWSSTIDYRLPFVLGTKISLSYFNIDYKDRLTTPAAPTDLLAGIPSIESRFPGLLTQNPTEAQVAQALSTVVPGGPVLNLAGAPWNPASGAAGLLSAYPSLILFNDLYTNIAVEKVQGLDLLLNTTLTTSAGDFEFGVNASYTLDHTRRITSASPPITLINQVGKPVGLRARVTGGWTRGAFNAFAAANYTDSYNNAFSTPLGRIGSWTTVDLTLRVDGDRLFNEGFFRGLSASLSATNLFDRNPPAFLESTQGFRYDAANASAVGRFVSIRLVKTW
jgi:iron complex outermembrane recepter protein